MNTATAIGRPAPRPRGALPFGIGPTDKVVTIGAGTASNLAQTLRAAGAIYVVTEDAHPIVPKPVAREFQYGLYSARYGEVRTSRQLLQLLRRAYGRFVPRDDARRVGARYVDPFRPAVQPGGFASWPEYLADRRQHFAAVRRAFEQADVLVVTLADARCWLSTTDGAAYPQEPDPSAGDASEYQLVSLPASEIADDMRSFVRELRAVNQAVRVVLTISADSETLEVLFRATDELGDWDGLVPGRAWGTCNSDNPAPHFPKETTVFLPGT